MDGWIKKMRTECRKKGGGKEGRMYVCREWNGKEGYT